VDGHVVQGRGGVSRVLSPACLCCVAASFSGIRTLPVDFHGGDGDMSVYGAPLWLMRGLP
jgi:hypothetical protein